MLRISAVAVAVAVSVAVAVAIEMVVVAASGTAYLTAMLQLLGTVVMEKL